MRKLLVSISALIVLALACSVPSHAQPAGAFQAITPLTRDLGNVRSLSAQTAGTLVSADQSGFNVTRVICVFRQSTFTNSPSTTFKIQNKDAASGQYYDVITSSAITSSTAANPIAMGADMVNASNSTASFPVAAAWRVSVTVGGTTPIVTGTIGCSVQ